ncbi:cyclin-dependent kinase b2-1 [Phtheirospermum japonicum]|uniref:Cyclin-dependent kinase b2-1 n=1 Tax=Phtheirospermum japonicum TaxID=374723 RepID=A0A830BVX3_9LAMI|nr:cyclin-dependent kinase b2-1 [Phtheirospermum japonicum]
MWSVGCIMAELLLNQVLFQGSCEIRQLLSIYMVLGSPDDLTLMWPRGCSTVSFKIFLFIQSTTTSLRINFLIIVKSS